MRKRTSTAPLVALLGILLVGAFTQMSADTDSALGLRHPFSLADIGNLTTESDLDLDVKLVPDASYSIDNIPLEVVFTNRSNTSVRLLNAFGTLSSKRVFFRITLVDSRESPVFTSGGGKISFTKDSMKYVELAKDEKFAVTINLRDFELSSKPPEPGIYSVLVTYQNEYGENCFVGTLKSELRGLVLVNYDWTRPTRFLAGV